MSRSTPRHPVLMALLAAATLLAGCGTADAPTVSSDDLGATPQAVDDGTPGDGEPGDGPSEDVEEPSPTPTPTPTPEPPTFAEVCEGRDDEAFIEVLTPSAGAELADGFTVTGCGNTFEATYLWRVELPDGSVAAEGFGTMSCGNGCVGSFEQEVTVGATGPATLVVFESSAQDGSELHVVEVPVVVT